ncbi:MAG TPA: MFS transporter [Terriglobales bacterium]|nr:MFS transporter [Terriglobales bacterium]
MTFSDRLEEIRTGFERPFWVANISEIFERLSYYAVFAVLARYLHEALQFPSDQSSSLSGLFGGAVWVMAIFGGALADRIGFRRALSLAYFILSFSYFMVGSIAAPWLEPVRRAVPLGLMAGVILFLPALGVALVKPSVVGTTARASKESVRSLGYSIYYTMVNIGSFLGPFLAGWIQERMRAENVFRLAALSVFLMFLGVLIFFREPRREREHEITSLGQVVRNLAMALGNWRFVLFLLIFSGYWIVFWQQYLSLPIYLHDYVDARANTAMILIADPIIVITLTVAVTALTQEITSFGAITLGTLITGVGWIVLGVHPRVWTAVVSLIIVALGEITQQPRYYEYISRLAPPGQQGTYMGFAFLPIGIGSLIGGRFGGLLLHHFGEVQHQPERIWWVITGVGILTTLGLWLYDKVFMPSGSGAE